MQKSFSSFSLNRYVLGSSCFSIFMSMLFLLCNFFIYAYMFSALMKTREEIKQFHLCTLPCINTSVMFVMIFSLTLNVIERIPSSLQLFDVEV